MYEACVTSAGAWPQKAPSPPSRPHGPPLRPDGPHLAAAAHIPPGPLGCGAPANTPPPPHGAHTRGPPPPRPPPHSFGRHRPTGPHRGGGGASRRRQPRIALRGTTITSATKGALARPSKPLRPYSGIQPDLGVEHHSPQARLREVRDHASATTQHRGHTTDIHLLSALYDPSKWAPYFDPVDHITATLLGGHAACST